MDYISGKILTENGFEKGYLCIKDDYVTEQNKGIPPSTPIQNGLIVPTFIDMHTHIGDSFIRKKQLSLPKNLMELVAPPDGLKHRLLNEASETEILQGMIGTVQQMITTGTSGFVDFRENGLKGICLIKEALESEPIKGIILGRPKDMIVDKNEISTILQLADGIGISSISDWDIEGLYDIASLVHKKGKMFAMHASERIREDIDTILELRPTFIIHMTKALHMDFEKTKKQHIPIVICPRSNLFFGGTLPLSLLKEVGNTVLIGSDNAMLHDPSPLLEIKHLLQMYPDFLTLEQLLLTITYAPRKVLNLKDGIPHFTFPESFLVLDQQTLAPKYWFLSGKSGIRGIK